MPGMTNPAADPASAPSSDVDPVAQAQTLTQAVQGVLYFMAEALLDAVAGHPEMLTGWLSDFHKSSIDVSGHPLVVEARRWLEKHEERQGLEGRTARAQAWEHLEKAVQIAVEGKKGGLEDGTILVILDRFLGDGKPQPSPLEVIFEKVQGIVIQAAQARAGGCAGGCADCRDPKFKAGFMMPAAPPNFASDGQGAGDVYMRLQLLRSVLGQIEYLWLRLDPAQQEELIASLKETFHYPADADATQPPAAG